MKGFWEVFKGDLMVVFKAFLDGSLPLFQLNFRMIVLLPKKKMQYKSSTVY
jgi:hypothetical protein